MKVVFIAKNIPLPGHDENDIVLNLAKALNRKGVSVSTYYPKEVLPSWVARFSQRLSTISTIGKRFVVSGVSINTIPYFRFFYMNGIEWLGAFLPLYNKKAIDADIIHSHFVFPDLIIASSINIYNKPLVVTVRQGDFNNAKKSALNKYLFKKYLRKAAVIVALTPTIADKLKSYVIDSSKIKVIPNFIDSNFFEHPFLQSKSKEGKIGVICVANLIKRKNVDWLIRIHSNLPDLFNLTIVGSGTEYSMLKSIASDSVIFTGKLARDDVISYLDANDLFILPSDKETFGLVFVEALSRGLPTIGKVGTGLDGFDSSALYFVNDEVELEELIKFHAAEHKEGVDHSESAMSFSTKFSEEQVVSLHLEVYESLI